MKFELCHYDNIGLYEKLQEAIFLASHHRFSLVSVPLGYYQRAEFFIEKTPLAATIDFPHGNSPANIRIAGILDAINKGAKIIDLVANHSLIANEAWKDFSIDIRSAISLCGERDRELRVIIDYRLFEPEKVLEICRLLAKLGIETVITSTGTVVDDFLDNVIICEQIGKLGLKTVLASNSISPAEFRQVRDELDVHALRFLSANLVRHIFGDY